MTTPKIQVDDLVREMTADELKAYEERQALAQAQEAEAQAKIAARESALAKLAAIGLTQAEINSL